MDTLEYRSIRMVLIFVNKAWSSGMAEVYRRQRCRNNIFNMAVITMEISHQDVIIVYHCVVMSKVVVITTKRNHHHVLPLCRHTQI